MPSTTSLRPDEKKFSRRLQDIRRQVGRLEDSQVDKLLTELRAVRGDVAAALTKVAPTDDSWNAFHLRSLEGAIDDVFQDFASRYERLLKDGSQAAWDLGTGALPDALGAAGARAPDLMAGLPQLFAGQLEAAHLWYPDLVQGVTGRAKTALGKHLRRGLMAQETPTKIMDRVMKYLDVPARPTGKFGGLAYQAERLVRTEVGRMYNVGNAARQDHTLQVMDSQGMASSGMKRVWLHSGQVIGARESHIRLHGTSVPAVGGLFDVGGFQVEFPQAPGLPAREVINCRCDHILWSDDWGPHPIDFPPGSDATRTDIPTPIHDEVMARLRGQTPGVAARMTADEAAARVREVYDSEEGKEHRRQMYEEYSRIGTEIVQKYRELDVHMRVPVSERDLAWNVRHDTLRSEVDLLRMQQTNVDRRYHEKERQALYAANPVQGRVELNLAALPPGLSALSRQAAELGYQSAAGEIDEMLRFFDSNVWGSALRSGRESWVNYPPDWMVRMEATRPPPTSPGVLGWYKPENESIYITAPWLGVGAHEFGHWLAYHNDMAHAAEKQFLIDRVDLQERAVAHSAGVWVYADQFTGSTGAYAGRVYVRGGTGPAPDQTFENFLSRDTPDTWTAVETLSTSLERFYRSPYELLRADPETFRMVWQVISGRGYP